MPRRHRKERPVPVQAPGGAVDVRPGLVGPGDVLHCLMGNLSAVVSEARGYRDLVERLDAYHVAHPQRWAHVMAFLHGVASPAPADLAHELAEGKRRAGARR